MGNSKYDNMPLLDGSGRPIHRMSTAERARIFVPFDPLKGYQEALREKEREAEASRHFSLSEDHAAQLDARLRELDTGSLVRIVFWREGHYGELRGKIDACSAREATLTVAGQSVAFSDIRDLEVIAP